jgi:hypothetical protein
MKTHNSYKMKNVMLLRFNLIKKIRVTLIYNYSYSEFFFLKIKVWTHNSSHIKFLQRYRAIILSFHLFEKRENNVK